MSAVVLTFPKGHSKKEPSKLPTSPRMYCMNCDGFGFAIFSDGNIHCLVCSAHIKNLRTVEL